MGPYPADHEITDWSKREHEIKEADPSQLPGRKLVAEACIVDLLAPMVAETCPIPEHVELLVRAGWCGWNTGGVESRWGVVPPDPRTVSRYASDLRGLSPTILSGVMRDLILELYREQAAGRPERALNATCVKKLLCSRVPWIHREMVNGILSELSEKGWLRSTFRGFRWNPEPEMRELPAVSPEVALAEIFQDVYPALTAYADLQPGAVAGLGWLIATPARLELLGQQVDRATEAVMIPYEEKARELPAERRVVIRLHRLSGPVEASSGPSEGPGLAQANRMTANEEVRLLGPGVAVAAFPGWGNPDEAGRGLKGAVALQLQQACQGMSGGLYRAAHRCHGIGNGTLAGYFDGPVLISRNSGKIRAVREGEAFRLESESLRLLSQAYPDTRSERWLWSLVSDRTETLSFQDFRSLLLKLAREGYVLMSRAGRLRYYRATRPYQAKPVLRMWDRWQKLWRWLPALRRVSGALRTGTPGATIGRGRWVVDREDLSLIEEQIQDQVNASVEKELERYAHLDEVDHLSMGGRKSHIIIFTRQEPWILTQLEDP